MADIQPSGGPPTGSERQPNDELARQRRVEALSALARQQSEAGEPDSPTRPRSDTSGPVRGTRFDWVHGFLRRVRPHRLVWLALVCGACVVLVAAVLARAGLLPVGQFGALPAATHTPTSHARPTVTLSPALAGITIYVGADSGSTALPSQLIALDARTGAVRWSAPLNQAGNVTSAAGSGIAYSATSGHVDALAVGDGKPLWSYQHGGAGSGYPGFPTLANGILYVSWGDGALDALDAARGGPPLWSFQGSGNGYGVAAPAVTGTTVFVAKGGPDLNVYALDAQRGSVRWSAQLGADPNAAPPVVANGLLYLTATNGALDALDAGTGVVRWHYTPPAASVGGVAAAGGLVFAGSADGMVSALDASTGIPRWHYPLAPASYLSGSPVVTSGTVFVSSNQGTIYALDATTGTLQWRVDLDPTGSTSALTPAIADGAVYVATPDGNVYALDAATGARAWGAQVRGQISGTPVLAA